MVPLLGKKDSLWFKGHYFKQEDQQYDPRFALLRQERFTHLPPAIVVTAEHDRLRDEAHYFAQKLRENGNQVTYHQMDDVIHGFAVMASWTNQVNVMLNYIKQFMEEL